MTCIQLVVGEKGGIRAEMWCSLGDYAALMQIILRLFSLYDVTDGHDTYFDNSKCDP